MGTCLFPCLSSLPFPIVSSGSGVGTTLSQSSLSFSRLVAITVSAQACVGVNGGDELCEIELVTWDGLEVTKGHQKIMDYSKISREWFAICQGKEMWQHVVKVTIGKKINPVMFVPLLSMKVTSDMKKTQVPVSEWFCAQEKMSGRNLSNNMEAET